MCLLQNIHVALRGYQESVTSGQTDGQTDTEQSHPYMPLCFAGDTKIEVHCQFSTFYIFQTENRFKFVPLNSISHGKKDYFRNLLTAYHYCNIL